MGDSRTDDRSVRTTDDPAGTAGSSPEGDDRSATHGGSRLRTLVRTAVRLVVDLAILALWVVFLALLFLETAWPRWAFYAALLIGVAVYVSITAPWAGDGTSSGVP